MSRELSERASKFLDDCTRVDAWAGPIRREMIAVNADLVRAGDGIDEALSRIVRFDALYGGRVIPVSGGVLAGSLTLGCGSRPVLRRSSDGRLVFQMARHDSAQCAVVMSADGAAGCSWSTEFHPLFDSIEHLIEDCAAWRQIRGWKYVAISDFDPSLVMAAIGDLSLDESASGESAKWWIGGGIAVVSHPYLNPGRGASMQVAVVAASAQHAERVKKTLEAEGLGDRGVTAASLWGAVG
ncbi:hypothetical protein ABT247_08420 [Kitasatospora sp. NPDC001539]|uniref:hypothetical protein n=1 Tax=Kitasatospora sp. NPDC001539 TaxID=3154384 RepID=UPI00332A83BB